MPGHNREFTPLSLFICAQRDCKYLCKSAPFKKVLKTLNSFHSEHNITLIYLIDVLSKYTVITIIK